MLIQFIFLLTYYKLLNGSFFASPYNFGNGQWPATQTTEPGDGAVGFNTEGIVFDRTLFALILRGII